MLYSGLGGEYRVFNDWNNLNGWNYWNAYNAPSLYNEVKRVVRADVRQPLIFAVNYLTWHSNELQ